MDSLNYLALTDTGLGQRLTLTQISPHLTQEAPKIADGSLHWVFAGACTVCVYVCGNLVTLGAYSRLER